MQVVLSIILFLIALGVLVTIHECGHFIAAKSFNVYCSDFSIGFGPKICKIKRKKGETKFSIGILPIGGYVSMFGEGTELPEGVKIPRSRSLIGIARWKRLIIFAAGVIMNFVLAYIIFFICASCFPQYSPVNINSINISNTETYIENPSITDLDGNNILDTYVQGDIINASSIKLVDQSGNDEIQYVFPNLISDITPIFDENGDIAKYQLNYTNAELITINEETKSYILAFNSGSNGIKQLDEIANFLVLYEAKEIDLSSSNYRVSVLGADKNNETTEYELVINDNQRLYLPIVNEDSSLIQFSGSSFNELAFNINRFHNDNTSGSEKEIYHNLLHIKDEDQNGRIDPLNIGINYHTYWNGWNSFKVAGDYWVQSTSLISEAIGNLFVGQGWDQMGGPVAIFTQTTSILQNYPFNYYLQSWGTISVNLALINLLPFPGLDGWQILVTIIEGVVNFIKKQIYLQKVKSSKSNVNPKLLDVMTSLNEDIDDIKRNYKEKYETNLDDDIINLNFPCEGSLEANELSNDPKYNSYLEYIHKVDALNDFKEKENLGDVEVYKEWAIPEKIKNIVSYIGLILLFALIAVIFVMDIWRLF